MFASEHSSGDSRSASAGGASVPTGDPVATSRVVAAILAVGSAELADSLAAVAAQDHPVVAIVVIGRVEAVPPEVAVHATVGDLVTHIAGDVTHVWLLHSDSRPRRDALKALVHEIERNHASMAGSKVLVADRPEVLESIGSATDVFGVPYSGLEEGEVDHEQYDVVRDVAYVSGVSILLRRDLLRGLGGPDPLLPPEAAGLDLSQRARVAGGRVVVVPSSEVLHSQDCEHHVPGWRERAGRLRAVLKAYRPITLAWMAPLAFLTGLVEGLGRLLLGSPTRLAGHLLASGWNLAHLPSLIRARRALASIRQASDEELFRYQVRGSVELRQLGSEFGARLDRWVGEDPESLLERSRAAWRSPVVVAAGVGAALVLAATRSIWFDGLPDVGFALPLPDSAWSTLLSYAGGWNSAGLGSPEPFHPTIGVTAALQLVLLGRGPLTMTLITVGALLMAIAGTARLLKIVGCEGPWRYLAGAVGGLGPFAASLGQAGYWPGIVGAGFLPWAVVGLCRPFPATLRARLGWAARTALPVTLTSCFLPLAGPAAILVVLLGLASGALRHLSIALAAGLGVLAAALALMPWTMGTSLDALVGGGAAVVPAVSWWWLGPAAAALVLSVVAAPPALLPAALWGGATASIGVLLSLTPGLGREPTVGLMAAASLGLALLTGACLETLTRTGPRRLVGLAGLALLATVAPSLVDGTANLPGGSIGEVLAFTAGLAPEHGADRALVFGPAGFLPGESRSIDGLGYRLVWAPSPRLTEAWLPEPRLGDDRLDDEVRNLLGGGRLRPGLGLASYGVRWVVVMGGADVDLSRSIDLRPLPISPDFTAYVNENARPVAVGQTGRPWLRMDRGYSGATGGDVRLAENADPRWGGTAPDTWSQDGWANLIGTAGPTVSFAPQPIYRWGAIAAALWVCLLAALAAYGRPDNRSAAPAGEQGEGPRAPAGEQGEGPRAPAGEQGEGPRAPAGGP
jgi:GT2 family glycosyltransferase